jgi:hypothetical protein
VAPSPTISAHCCKADTSVKEIDRLIAELENLRETLSTEGARVQREIVLYACIAEPGGDATRSSRKA